MIGYLRGTIIEKRFPFICLDVNGVGYEIIVSLKTFSSSGNLEEEGKFYISTVVRENSIELFGFEQAQEKQMFLKLIQVSGIGPKSAIGILSQTEPDHFIAMVNQRDVKALSYLKGIGKKTAERIILELSGKLTLGNEQDLPDGSTHGSIYGEVTEALSSLGFTRREIASVVKKLEKQDFSSQDKLEDYISRALSLMSKKK